MTELQSLRLFEKDAVVRCAICGSENVEQPGFCARCLTPLEVSRSVASRGAAARFVTVLGASGAGKTVYLGLLLDILSKSRRGLRGLPNGSFSVSLQQETITALQQRRFPEKTATEADHWRWVHCEITHDRKRGCFDLITPDLAGEAIALEIEQPGTFNTIRMLVRKSEGMLVLIDSLRSRDAGREEDLFAMKLLSYVRSLHVDAHSSRRSELSVPIALVFTKCDLCPEAVDDPSAFAAANMPALLHFCERNLADYRFFGVSLVGASVAAADDRGHRMLIPLHIEPRGVTAPLQWILEHF